MPIPSSRQELIQQVTLAFNKLYAELEDTKPSAGDLPCIDDWTIKDLLAVRAWWTDEVVAWIEAGRQGEIPVTPAKGYSWNETPRLNAAVVARSQGKSFQSICTQLELGFHRVRNIIDELSDSELLDAGVFEWAGKWPIARWISINTTRQYTTARTLIRRALRQ
ncbi:MAG: ClbS/DfsB family four-helix bundle protein [Phycisphaerae bacterium]